MRFAKKQAGLGILGWLVLILVVGGGITVGIKLIPLYIDNRIMIGDLKAFAKSQGATIQTDDAIRRDLRRRFSIDNVRNFDYQKNIKVERSSAGVYVRIAYQIKEPLAANVALLVTFDQRVRLVN